MELDATLINDIGKQTDALVNNSLRALDYDGSDDMIYWIDRTNKILISSDRNGTGDSTFEFI